MNWWAQVAHVASKDVRMSRWYLAGYAVVVGLAAASGLELVPGTLWPLLVLLLAAICTAVAIQTDSPYRADAFWATRPLTRTAVVTAKFAYIVLVLVGIGVAGQAAALLLGYGVTAAGLASLIGESALAFGGMLVGAALVAAFTPNLQSYLLVSALLLIAYNVIGMSLTLAMHGPAADTTRLALPIGFALDLIPLVVVAHMYRTRSRKLGIWAQVFLFIASLVVIPLLSMPAPAAVYAEHEPPAHVATPALGAWLDPRFNHGTKDLTVYAQLDSPSQEHRYVLAGSHAELRYPDGMAVRVPIEHLTYLNRPALPHLAGTRWRHASSGYRPTGPAAYETAIPLELSPEQWRAISNGEARLVIQGRIEVLERRMRLSVSLARGGVAFNSGQRLRVLSVNTVGETVQLEVSRSRVGRAEPWQADPPAFDESEYALINRALNEALALRRGAGNGTGLGLVIPGTDGFRRTVRLSAQWPASGHNAVDGASWLDGAELLRFEWHSVGSYPVSIEAAASPPSQR